MKVTMKVATETPGAGELRDGNQGLPRPTIATGLEVRDMIKVINKLADPYWSLAWNCLSDGMKVAVPQHWAADS